MNGSFGSIATMYVRRDKLIPDLPLVHYDGLDFGADFIVKDFEIDVVPTVGKVAHDGVAGGQSILSDLLTYGLQRIALQRLWKAMVMY